MESISTNINRRSRRSREEPEPSLSSTSGETILRRRRKKRRGKGRGRKRKAGVGRKLLKVDRLARSNLRILYWNCGSLSVRLRTADMLASDNDIVCLQETQHAVLKHVDFQAPIVNKKVMVS